VILGVKDATDVIREGAILTLDMQRGLVYSGTVGSQTDEALSV
jgi:pyruvate kinase